MTDARATLSALISKNRESMAAISRLLGRNDAWLQQFLKRGTPRQLPERERRILARYFNVDERELGATDPWRP